MIRLVFVFFSYRLFILGFCFVFFVSLSLVRVEVCGVLNFVGVNRELGVFKYLKLDVVWVELGDVIFLGRD